MKIMRFNSSISISEYIQMKVKYVYCLGRIYTKGDLIMWTTPAATEMRFGFEVTMYVCNK